MKPGVAALVVLIGWIGLLAAPALFSVLPPWATEHLAAPDVALQVVLFLAFVSRAEVWELCALSLLLGYLEDLTVGAPKGIHMLALPLTGIVARGASMRLLIRGAGVIAFAVALCAFLFGMLVLALRIAINPGVGWTLLQRLPGAAVTSGLTAPFVFSALRRVGRSFRRNTRPHLGRSARLFVGEGDGADE